MINWPSILVPSNLTIRPRNVVATTESPFTLERRTYEFTGERWEIEGSLPLLTRDKAEAFSSFVLALRQKVGRFLFPLPQSIAFHQGAPLTAPKVDGAEQGGRELAVKDLPESVLAFKAGDFINLGTGTAATRLYKVLADVASDSEGKATLPIWPALRTSPSDGAAIEVDNVAVVLQLAEDVEWSIDYNRHYLMTFNAVEAI